MKNRSFVPLLFALSFVGFTSCGNEDQNSGLAAENAALRATLANRNNVTTVQATALVVATAVVNVTYTAVGTSSTTSSTNTVYTVTRTSSNTSTAASSSTSTASRQ